MRFGHLAAELQGGDRLLPSDRGEAVQELVQPIPGFEVIVQRLHWHAGAHEDRRTAQNVWVSVPGPSFGAR
jgi:hypothetical protein